MTHEMTARSVPHPVSDPESIPPALDLSRPELTELMNRYEGAPSPLGRPRVALVVQRPGLPQHGVKEVLSGEGWEVQTCDGPAATICPLMAGEPCALRERADVAVVYVDQSAGSTATNVIPRLRCAGHAASPSVVAIEGGIGSPRYGDRTAVVGALRDPRTIMGAIKSLLRLRSR